MEDDEDIQQWDKNYDLAEEDKVYYGSDSTSFDESSEESEDNDYDKVGDIEYNAELDYYDEEGDSEEVSGSDAKGEDDYGDETSES